VRYVLLGLLVLSTCFAFVTRGAAFSWGGALGEYSSSWLIKWIGSFGTGAVLLIAGFSYVIWRFMNSCDSLINVLGSTIIGLIVGMGIFLVHVYLFGRYAVNLLGLPILADKTAEGKPLYVCSPSVKPSVKPSV
jgi:hypothetical protein